MTKIFKSQLFSDGSSANKQTLILCSNVTSLKLIIINNCSAEIMRTTKTKTNYKNLSKGKKVI